MSSKTGIPMFMCVDQEGGLVNRVSFGITSSGNMGLAATGDTELTFESADMIGEEIRSLGFNVDFAPVSDVNNNPANPIIGTRSFSDDPETVSPHVTAFIKGLKTKADGSFNARSKVLSDGEFENLKNLASREFEKCSNNVSNAKFDISPIRKEEDNFVTACKYCNFKDICFRTNDDIRNIKKSLGGENNG